MNTRGLFGEYLLLKKLTEDALGETFRAGMLGDGTVERMVLLRVYNGQGIDGQRLWQAARDRAEISAQLRSPNLGDGVEVGELHGLPFVAYDYISGKNMADLLEHAAQSRDHIPAEHALLITQRMALALVAASERRLRGERILHGFLTPHLVMISNEGEARLLGFEVAPGLRTFAANPLIRQAFGRYLAPETLQGQDPHPADDIYSLGVLLYELLTGRPLPPPAQDGFATIIGQGIVATEGTPIPAEVQDLMKRSLVPREHRIADVGTWHKALNKLMFEGQYNPTSFNLAVFMHNRFRRDIERESQELEIEKTLPAATLQQQAQVAAIQFLELPDESTGVGEGTGAGVGGEVTALPPGPEKETANPKSGLIVAAAVLLLAVLAGGGYWLWSRQRGGEEVAAQAAPPPPATIPVEPEPPFPTGPSEEELSAKIEELIARQADEMKSEIRRDYERQLTQLQKQLDPSRREAAERPQRKIEEAEPRAREGEAEPRVRAQEAGPTVRAQDSESRARGREAEPRAPGQEAARVTELAAQVAAVKHAAEESTAPEAAAPEAAAEEVPVAGVTPPPVAEPDRPIHVGGDVRKPEIIYAPQPQYTDIARKARIQGVVIVQAIIEKSGDVEDVKILKGLPMGLSEEALKAIKRWRFKPATLNGEPVGVYYNLTVNFRLQK